MRRTAYRVATLAALVFGCSPQASTPSSTDPVGDEVILSPAQPKAGVGLASRKKKKEPGPNGGTPRSSAVRPNSNL